MHAFILWYLVNTLNVILDTNIRAYNCQTFISFVFIHELYLLYDVTLYMLYICVCVCVCVWDEQVLLYVYEMYKLISCFLQNKDRTKDFRACHETSFFENGLSLLILFINVKFLIYSIAKIPRYASSLIYSDIE